MGQTAARFLVNMFSRILKKIQPLALDHTKMVFLVRTDLQMGKGKIASQVAHAAILLYEESIKNQNPFLNTWLRWGQPKIVLKIDKNCESALQEVYEKAFKNNLTVCKVLDAGKTQVDEGSVTVIGIGPNKVEEIDKITNGFKLL